MVQNFIVSLHKNEKMITGSQRNRLEKESKQREGLSKYLYDVSKLVLTCTVVAFLPVLVIKQQSFTSLIGVTLLGGIITACIFAYIANRIMKF